MLTITILIFILAIFALVSSFAASPESKPILRGVSTVGFVVGILLIMVTMIRIVPVGHVGVNSVFGKVNLSPLPEGLHMVSPLVHTEMVSVRMDEYTMTATHDEGATRGDDSIKVYSKDTLPMNVDMTINYRPIASMVPWLMQHVGRNEDFITKIIRPASRSSIRTVVSKFTAIEAISQKREIMGVEFEKELNNQINSLLRNSADFKGDCFMIRVMIRNIDPPENLKKSIEAKLIADQDAQRMQYVLAKETQEAERKRIEAQGIADFQKIVSVGISDALLKWKGIEATQELAKSPNTKVIVIGGKDGMPLILNGDTASIGK